jgi:hypothetical protein
LGSIKKKKKKKKKEKGSHTDPRIKKKKNPKSIARTGAVAPSEK